MAETEWAHELMESEQLDVKKSLERLLAVREVSSCRVVCNRCKSGGLALALYAHPCSSLLVYTDMQGMRVCSRMCGHVLCVCLTSRCLYVCVCPCLCLLLPPCLFLFVLMCHYQAIQSELALDVAPDVVVTAQIKSVPRTAKVIFFLKKKRDMMMKKKEMNRMMKRKERR